MNPLRIYIRNILLEYVTTQDIEDVKQTAYLVHMGQTRRDQTPYISHPLEVYNITKRYYPRNHAAQLLALLHDTLEDAEEVGNVSKEEAHSMIQASIHDNDALMQVNTGLALLTHDKSVPYSEYLNNVLQHPTAAIVKISDLIHNLSHNPSVNQILKYRTALKSVSIPNHISDSHLAELVQILEES